MPNLKNLVKCSPLLASLLLTLAYPTHAQTIPAEKAAFHIGEDVVACGIIKQVKDFRRGVYLNLSDRYPNQGLTVVVWNDDLKQFEAGTGNLQGTVGKKVCASGIIKRYKSQLQITPHNTYSLEITSS